MDASPTASAGTCLISDMSERDIGSYGRISRRRSNRWNMPTGGAGSWTNASDVANATYTASSSERGSITLTSTTSGGGCGTATDTKNITVNANPTASAGSALIIGMPERNVSGYGRVSKRRSNGWNMDWRSGELDKCACMWQMLRIRQVHRRVGGITLTLTTSGGSCGTTTDTDDYYGTGSTRCRGTIRRDK